jgi:hypothetical protein
MAHKAGRDLQGEDLLYPLRTQLRIVLADRVQQCRVHDLKMASFHKPQCCAWQLDCETCTDVVA